MNTTNQTNQVTGGELSALCSSQLGGDKVPERVLLAPWGHVESTNGSFIVDEESAALTIEAMSDQATDTPIDYEHQTLGGSYASPSGQAPAAGWIKQVVAEPGVGLVALIEWTEQAAQMLAAKEYRYLSPVALIRKSDRKLIGIHSAALTNKPAIKGMRPIVNRAEHDVPDNVEPVAALRQTLALADDAGVDEVLLAASRKLHEVRAEAERERVDRRVEDAMREGKLVEAQRAWAAQLLACGEPLFDEWLRTAPVVVAVGATRPPGGDTADERRQRSVEACARGEYRSNPLLQRLTSEAAYVSSASRDLETERN